MVPRRGRALFPLGLIMASFVLAPPSAMAALSTEQLEQPITANFREVDFESAMQFLAESAGVNIVISPKAKELSKPVTLRLVEIPLRRALEYLVRGQGLIYRLDDDAVFVASLDEVESEPLETKVFNLTQGPGLFANFEPSTETRDSVALQAHSVKQLTTIKDVLEKVIPEVSGRSILLDERSGSLIVTHVPYYLQQIEQLLQQIDVQPTEVRIHARFVELTSTDTDQWSFDAGLTGDAALTKKDSPDGSTQSPEFKLSSLGTTLRRGTKIDFTDFARQTSGDALNLTLQGVLTGTQYQAVLYALSENKKTKTLSAPQVTTLNNQTATLKVVTEFVYASKFEASVKKEDLNEDGDFVDVVNGVRETRFVNVPQDFVTKDLGVLLNVTPSVGIDKKTIILGLKPEVSEKKTDDSFSGDVTLPRFTTRNLETTVVVETGETVVLGGLMKDTNSKTVTRVPFLSSIPLLGSLFTKRSTAVERSNLLIFVTASIVPSAGANIAHEASVPVVGTGI